MPVENANPILPVTHPMGTDKEMLDELLAETFPYFLAQVNLDNGLISDKTKAGTPASIAVIGFGLSCYAIAVERGLMQRDKAVSIILTTLRFFYNSPQSEDADAMGYKGFYYHFLDMQTGRRAWQSELSTIDTALLIAGMLSVGAYFTGDNEQEKEVRELSDQLYRRVDWQWACNNKKTITHGWKPATGFLRYRWNKNLSEAHILYILALGSPTHAIDPEGYHEWIRTFEWIKVYDIEYCYAGPLFIHQFMHLWLDLKDLHDGFNRKTGIDYFENSARAAHVHRHYAIDNPKNFEHYNHFSWGLTASDGPGPARRKVKGADRVFYDYLARGAPYGPDDGTVSPWAVVASLPFAPGIVLPTIRHAIERLRLKSPNKMGFDASFNATFPEKGENPYGWVSPWRFGLNEGPTVMMIDNYQHGLLWKIMKTCPYIIAGLKNAGFKGGWLTHTS